MRLRVMTLLLCVAMMPALAWGQTDAEGSKDHPVVPRLAGGQYYISDYQARDFGAHEFTVKDTEQRVEGRFTAITYWLKDGGKAFSGVEIGRNYQRAVAEKKGETMHFDINNGGGHAVFRLVVDGRRVWIGVDVSNDGEVYELTVVEEAEMVQSVELRAGAMAAALMKDGRVVLRGILFDTGKATITEASTAQIDAIVELLKSDVTLRLEIIGHTDNTGTTAGNATLSTQRAAAVKAWLVGRGGVAADRLATSGRGDTQPVADNATEEGRAQNRRVELVRRQPPAM